MNTARRLGKIRESLAKQGVDAILVSQAENIHYLSGLSSAEAFLLITADRKIIATDFRYIEQTKRQAPDYEVFQISGGASAWFPGLVGGLSLKKLAFEAAQITVALHQKLAEAIGQADLKIELVPTERLVEALRVVKEPTEIELITKAVAIADRAFDHIKNTIRIGMTEREAAWEVERFMREHGSLPIPFEAIVAAGPNAALPHAQPSEHAIQAGEPIVIDIGARVEGYASDLTRTICLGQRDSDFGRVYAIVLSAQTSAIAGVREGMTGEEADAIARNIIKEAGYGEAFGHALGHGVGLATHEPPRLGPKSAEKLTGGMVFTIEPGIYLPGWGGVRIEDSVVMENGRVRVLSQSPK